ncbi:unnamed protein product [Amaranthus hypochondriacus]
MAGGNFMGRLMSYVINELLVNSLANSHAFQRFAVRTSKKIENISKIAQEKKVDMSEQLKDFSKKVEENLKNRQ